VQVGQRGLCVARAGVLDERDAPDLLGVVVLRGGARAGKSEVQAQVVLRHCAACGGAFLCDAVTAQSSLSCSPVCSCHPQRAQGRPRSP